VRLGTTISGTGRLSGDVSARGAELLGTGTGVPLIDRRLIRT
jgi:hypothetical protein